MFNWTHIFLFKQFYRKDLKVCVYWLCGKEVQLFGHTPIHTPTSRYILHYKWLREFQKTSASPMAIIALNQVHKCARADISKHTSGSELHHTKDKQTWSVSVGSECILMPKHVMAFQWTICNQINMHEEIFNKMIAHI